MIFGMKVWKILYEGLLKLEVEKKENNKMGEIDFIVFLDLNGKKNYFGYVGENDDVDFWDEIGNGGGEWIVYKFLWYSIVYLFCFCGLMRIYVMGKLFIWNLL